jgi:hypothetical protein
VYVGYAADDFHCLLDSELFLPESWAEDRARCQAAHIPDELVYRPKWQIALALYDARRNGVSYAYLTFDEGYSAMVHLLVGNATGDRAAIHKHGRRRGARRRGWSRAARRRIVSNTT